MKNIHTFLLSLVALAFFSSCEQLITEIDAPSSEPQLVVYSVISPQDSVIEVKVHKSNPLFSIVNYQSYDNRFPPVINATVMLNGEGQSVTIPYDEEYEAYRVDQSAINIKMGGYYEIKVMAPGFSQVFAECTVPDHMPPDIEITGTGLTEETGMEEWYFEFRFKDIPGVGHNYLVYASVINYDPWMEETYSYAAFFKQGNPLISDKLNDGGYFNYRTYPIVLQYLDANNVWVSLSLIDDNYFQYAQSINNFQDDNPFSEPTPIFSNIKGGLGVFAGMNSRIKAVPFQ
ncbi:MAG: DUF4249 domain-containing protein [Lentimicrobium sp.]|jgi:hypothetical protein|nr:DUF4249 domain-containing protein [Lentimicrobium sp.]